MALSATEKKHFRGIGHHLKPVVLIGSQGLSEAVLAEIDRALEEHELIKVKVHGENREARHAVLDALPEATGCQLVTTIGGVALIYRPAKKQNPKLSNLVRFSGG